MKRRFLSIMRGTLALLIWTQTSPCALKAATDTATQTFLHQHRHAWLPYPWPSETNTNELAWLLDYDFDTVGLSFAGSFHGGQMDFSKLDTAIAMVAARRKTAVLSLSPRFDESDGVFDQLCDGTFVTNLPYKNPNASMIDVFDPAQRAKFNRWIELCAQRYGQDKRVAGFVIGWGYMGETGYFIGDYLKDFKLLGSVASGYSGHALAEFNHWRAGLDLSPLQQLPMPSLAGANRDYILFHRFRTEFAGGVFQKEAIDHAKKFTTKPVGIFGYISVNTANYGRDWAFTPNADFFRSAVSAASFDLHRTLLDSGVGWEDHELHDGHWNFTVACLERDIARQIAHGGVFHAMPVRVYETEPQWETNFSPRIANFLLTQKLAAEVHPSPVEVALFQPTWSASALPVRSASNPFVPQPDLVTRYSKLVGLMESFGIPYRLITERDLLRPNELSQYKHVIIPLWDLMPQILGPGNFEALKKTSGIVPIPPGTKPITRSSFRELLKQNNIPIHLDFDSDSILAGRVNNLIFNWDDQPINVNVPGVEQSFPLKPMEYRFLP